MVLGHKFYDFSQGTVPIDPPDLTQLAICGHSNAFKAFERNGRVKWGDSLNLSKTLSLSSRGVRQFLQAAKEYSSSHASFAKWMIKSPMPLLSEAFFGPPPRGKRIDVWARGRWACRLRSGSCASRKRKEVCAIGATR